MRVEEEEAVPNKLTGSSIAFTLNGVLQGVAFQDFDEGTYYPMLSLYTLPQQAEGASVAVNFGPDFKFPPPQLPAFAQPVTVRPMSELAVAVIAGPVLS